jgi:hypothetical protein
VVNDGLVSGPDGIIAKNLSYLNSVFTPRPNRMIIIFCFCITTGMAAAAGTVA